MLLATPYVLSFTTLRAKAAVPPLEEEEGGLSVEASSIYALPVGLSRSVLRVAVISALRKFSLSVSFGAVSVCE